MCKRIPGGRKGPLPAGKKTSRLFNLTVRANVNFYVKVNIGHRTPSAQNARSNPCTSSADTMLF
jgi:hypothetical protein